MWIAALGAFLAFLCTLAGSRSLAGPNRGTRTSRRKQHGQIAAAPKTAWLRAAGGVTPTYAFTLMLWVLLLANWRRSLVALLAHAMSVLATSGHIGPWAAPMTTAFGLVEAMDDCFFLWLFAAVGG